MIGITRLKRGSLTYDPEIAGFVRLPKEQRVLTLGLRQTIPNDGIRCKPTPEGSQRLSGLITRFAISLSYNLRFQAFTTLQQ